MGIKDVIYFCAIQKASGATPLAVQTTKKVNGMNTRDTINSAKMIISIHNNMKVR